MIDCILKLYEHIGECICYVILDVIYMPPKSKSQSDLAREMLASVIDAILSRYRPVVKQPRFREHVSSCAPRNGALGGVTSRVMAAEVSFSRSYIPLHPNMYCRLEAVSACISINGELQLGKHSFIGINTHPPATP